MVRRLLRLYAAYMGTVFLFAAIYLHIYTSVPGSFFSQQEYLKPLLETQQQGLVSEKELLLGASQALDDSTTELRSISPVSRALDDLRNDCRFVFSGALLFGSMVEVEANCQTRRSSTRVPLPEGYTMLTKPLLLGAVRKALYNIDARSKLPATAIWTYPDFVYFSIVFLGNGDLTPNTTLTRLLIAFQSILQVSILGFGISIVSAAPTSRGVESSALAGQSSDSARSAN